MEFFKFLPKTNYSLDEGKTSKTVKNILIRNSAESIIDLENAPYVYVEITNDMSPQEIAYKYYGDENLYWLIFMANNITNMYSQWPMKNEEFEVYLQDKYGDSIYDVHHYEIENEYGDKQNINIGTDKRFHPEAIPVTNYEYEFIQESNKRSIRLFAKSYVTTIKNNMRSLMERYG